MIQDFSSNSRLKHAFNCPAPPSIFIFPTDQGAILPENPYVESIDLLILFKPSTIPFSLKPSFLEFSQRTTFVCDDI